MGYYHARRSLLPVAKEHGEQRSSGQNCSLPQSEVCIILRHPLSRTPGFGTLETCDSSGPIPAFASVAAGVFANAGIKGPLANICFQWSFGSEVRLTNRHATMKRTSEPPHWPLADSNQATGLGKGPAPPGRGWPKQATRRFKTGHSSRAPHTEFNGNPPARTHITTVPVSLRPALPECGPSLPPGLGPILMVIR